MAKRKDPVARARGRVSAAPVKKPFPLGFVLGSSVLAAFLIGIIVYAAQNQGVGDTSSLKYAESQVDGLEVDHDQSRKHVETPVAYKDEASTPPTGGEHSSTANTCQVYTTALANEHAVHSLEHGAVWVTYNPSLPAADVAKLKALVDGDPYRMLSPYPGLKSPISLQAWGERVFVDKVTDKRVERFLELFTSGPQTPEPGTACQGTTDTAPVVAPTTAPSVSASPAAS